MRVTSWLYPDEPAMFLAHTFNNVAFSSADLEEKPVFKPPWMEHLEKVKGKWIEKMKKENPEDEDDDDDDADIEIQYGQDFGSDSMDMPDGQPTLGSRKSIY